MDEVTKLLAEIKVDLLRKDETYRLVADCAPITEPCDGCRGRGTVGVRPCSFCRPDAYRVWMHKA